MKFDIITIFPNIFDSYFGESIIRRAKESGAIEIDVHNLRDWTTDKHKTVDDTPYGGGAGMVLKVEPIFNCVKAIEDKRQETRNEEQRTKNKKHETIDKGQGIKNEEQEKRDKKQETRNEEQETRGEGGENLNDPILNKLKTRKILLSAKGKRYTQADARRLAEYDNLIFICGRYEGVDERVAEYIADEEISVGDFVLTGGEIPAMIVVDSVSRLLPGVLGNEQSFQIESHSEEGYLEYPQYTKPEKFRDWNAPEVLLSGNHKEIEKWRQEKSKKNKK